VRSHTILIFTDTPYAVVRSTISSGIDYQQQGDFMHPTVGLNVKARGIKLMHFPGIEVLNIRQ
jgi:hypothetical protein